MDPGRLTHSQLEGGQIAAYIQKQIDSQKTAKKAGANETVKVTVKIAGTQTGSYKNVWGKRVDTHTVSTFFGHIKGEKKTEFAAHVVGQQSKISENKELKMQGTLRVKVTVERSLGNQLISGVKSGMSRTMNAVSSLCTNIFDRLSAGRQTAGPDLSKVPLADIKHIDPKEFANLSDDQVSKLTPEQLLHITGEQFSKLSPEQFNNLTLDQFSSLSPDKIASQLVSAPKILKENPPSEQLKRNPQFVLATMGTGKVPGAHGDKQSEDKSICLHHGCFADAALLAEKDGKVSDQAGAGTLANGNKVMVLTDGSGLSKESQATAAGVVEYGLASLTRDSAGFSQCNNADDCFKEATKIFAGALSVTHNPLIKDAHKNQGEGGLTTAIMCEIGAMENGNSKVTGGAVGDCFGFIVQAGDKPTIDIVYEFNLDDPKSVSDPGSQLQAPSQTGSNVDTNGQFGGNPAKGERTTAGSTVQGFYKEVEGPFLFVGVTDIGMDNIYSPDRNAVLNYIMFSDKFDTVPEQAPPNQFIPGTTKLPEFDLNAEKPGFKTDIPLPGKPDSTQLKSILGSNENSPPLPTSVQASTRLKNYITWITGGLIKTKELYDKNKVIEDLLPNNEKIKETINALNVYLAGKTDPGEISYLTKKFEHKNEGELKLYQAIQKEMNTKHMDIGRIVAALKNYNPEVTLDEKQNTALYMIHQDLEGTNGTTGKYDDGCFITMSIKGQDKA